MPLLLDSAAVRMNGRPEAELAVHCSRACINAGLVARMSALVENWSAVLAFAVRHGVAALVCRHLQAACPAAIPPKTLRRFCCHCDGNLANNLRLTAELLDLLQKFERSGLRALPFKGPVLAASLYGNLQLRPFGDLDILVSSRDVAKAKALLLAQGFQLRTNHHGTEAAERHFYHNHVFTRGPVIVELHWALAERYFGFDVDLDTWWSRLVTVSLCGHGVKSLAPEDLLLALCVHGTRHCWERLIWLCDIAELVRSQPLDWPRALAQAEALGGLRMVCVSLQLARDLLGAELPQHVIDKVQTDAAAQALASEVRVRLVQDRSVSEEEKKLFYLRVRERLRDRIRYCRRFAQIPRGADRHDLPRWARLFLQPAMALTPNERDWSWVQLPAALAGLYYLIRPCRLALGAARGLAVGGER